MAIHLVRGPLVIRSWRESDVDALAAAVSESLEHLRPFMPWVANEPMSPPERQALIERWNAEADASGDEVVGLFLDGRVVGGSGFHRRIGEGGLEIGYWVHRDFIRQGIATSAAAALTDEAFRRPGIDRVEIHHDVANVASGGVPLKLGFRLVGEEPREPKAPAETGVHRIWRITREEWTTIRGT